MCQHSVSFVSAERQWRNLWKASKFNQSWRADQMICGTSYRRRARPQFGWQRTDNKVSTSENRIVGHSKDKSDSTLRAHRRNRGAAGCLFFRFGQIEDVSAVVSKAIFATCELFLEITMSSKGFNNIPDILWYRGRNIIVIVEVHRPHCCFCRAAGHLANMCSKTNPAPPTTIPVGLAVTKSATLPDPQQLQWMGRCQEEEGEKS